MISEMTHTHGQTQPLYTVFILCSLCKEYISKARWHDTIQLYSHIWLCQQYLQTSWV